LGLVATSKGAVDFAANMLLKKDFRSFFGFSSETIQTHRTGGALALQLMPSNFGTEDILNSARRSFFRSLRQACIDAKVHADHYRFRLK
jgi:hypothetical protein